MSVLDQCNHSELYQTCRSLQLPALPSMSREQLMALLLEELPETEQQPNVFDSWRHGLAGFVLDHWAILQNQIGCPLKSQDPLSCFTCLDTQVVDCVVGNPANEHLIQLKRK